MGARPNRRNKAPFSNSFGIVWKKRNLFLHFDVLMCYHRTFSPGLISQVICFSARGSPSLYFRSNSSITIFPE